jgi:hypothetical protein
MPQERFLGSLIDTSEVEFMVEVRLIPMYSSHAIQTFYYCVSLSCIVWIHNLTITIVSQKYQELSVQLEISE